MQKFEFEGAQRTVREIHELVGGSAVIPKKTLRDRLNSGQKTVAEVRRPRPRYVNTAWNNSMFGKGHTA
jgi:hypothetical protein